MLVSITTDRNDNFKISEGALVWVDFTFKEEINIMRPGVAVINGDKIEIRPQMKWWWMFNFGNKKAEILKNGEWIGAFNYSWNKGMFFHIEDHSKVERTFRLYKKGFSKSYYYLVDENENSLFELKQNFKLLKLKTEYLVDIKDREIYETVFLVELLMYAIYGAIFDDTRTND